VLNLSVLPQEKKTGLPREIR
jgi:hypothetical protein